MPAEVGGAGLDTLTWVLYEKELGRANYALHWTVRGAAVEHPDGLRGRAAREIPVPRGARREADCLAMTEPGVGSDVRGMKTSAVRDGDDFVINGTKHFISHADEARFRHPVCGDGRGRYARQEGKMITAFLIDKGHPGFTVRRATATSRTAATTTAFCEFNDCRVPQAQILGEVDQGFEVANDWLGATRLQVAATCIGRAERALELAKQYAVDRHQFGQQIGKFQGVSFKLADMAMELKAAELLTLEAAWKIRPENRHRHGHGDGQTEGHRDAGLRSPTRRFRSMAAWG